MTLNENSATKTAPAGFRVVDISREPVELYKILKFENLVSSGAEAKAAVAASQVSVNGSIETRKRKQIVAGDTIEFGTEKIFIHLNTTTSHKEPVAIKTSPSKKKIAVNRKAIRISQSKAKGAHK